jgi:hypothetical protein
VTLNGTLDLTTVNGIYVFVQNGLTVNGTGAVNLGNGSGSNYGTMYFSNTQIVGGTGNIVFGGSTNNNLQLNAAGITVTLGSGLTIHGKSGQFYSPYSNSTWLDQTTAADVSGGTITISGPWTNSNGGFSAASGATVNLNGTVTNTSSTLTLAGAGNVRLTGGTIIGGTVAGTLSGTGSGGTLNGVTLSDTLDLVSINAANVTVKNNLTVNGTVNLGNSGGTTYGTMYFANSETIGGGGFIVFGGSASNSLQINAVNAIVTLGVNLTVHGKNGSFSNSAFGSAWVNQGTIAADVSGGTITLGGAWNGSSGTFSASTGATLNFTGTLNNAAGTFTASGAGIVQLGGGTINGGTLAGTLVGTTSGETLKGVTIAGTLDLTNTSGNYVYVRNSLTVNGTVSVGNGGGTTYGGLYFFNTQTVNGSGSIVLGGSTSNTMQVYSANSTVTLASGLTFHGKSGQFLTSYADSDTWVNQTTIAADVTGGTITLGGSWNGSSGVFSASTGAIINFNGTYTNTSSSLTLLGSGTIQLAGSGIITGGTVAGTLTGAGGTLSGVTLSGTLDLASTSGANVTVKNGLTVNGTVNLGASDGSTYGYMYFTNTEAIGGNGNIVFGGSTSNTMQINANNETVTISPNLMVHGKNGQFVNGADGSAWVNQGNIAADVSGGTITIGGFWTGDGGSFNAVSGAFVNFAGTYTNTGTTLALSGSGRLQLTGGTIIGGSVSGTLTGTTSVGTLDGVTLTGALDLTTNSGVYVFVQNSLTVDGTVNLGATDGTTYGGMYFLNTLTVGGSGSIVFGGSTNNIMQVYYANSTVTLGLGLTVHGKNGALNVSGADNVAWVNQAVVAADVSDGTLTLGGTWTNSGTFQTQNGGTLSVQSTPTNYAGNTLTGGSWQVFANSILRVPLSSGIVNNAATIVLDGANSNFYQDSGTTNALANFATNAAAGSFTIRNGRNFTTAGDFTNNGTLTVGAGTVLQVAGNLTNFLGTTLTGGTYNVAGTLKFTGANVQTDAATVVLDGSGSAVVDQADANGLANLATIASGGSFTVQNGRNFTPAGDFSNAGTLSVGSTSTFTVSGVYTQTGAANVQTGGTLVLAGGGSSSGSFTVASGGTLSFSGGTFALNTGAGFSGAGAVRVTGATVNVNATVIASNLELTDGGTISGSGALTVNNSLTWSGGTMSGSGSTALASGGTLTISGATDKTLSQRTLNLAGNTTWSGTGNLNLANSAVLNNQGTGVFTINNDQSVLGSGTFTNAGTLTKSSSTGTTSFASTVAFSTSGTVNLQTGTLSFAGGYNQSAGATNLSSGTTLTATVNLTGGTLSGSGTVTGDVTNGGVVEVGGAGAAGTLTISGNYVQSGIGVLNIEIGGSSLGTGFDQFVIAGQATLNGTLNVTLINSFSPNPGNSFMIVTFSGGSTGSFVTTNLPSGGSLTLNTNDATVAF